MPMTAKVRGRSPRARPTATGSRADPMAEIGATTDMRPDDSPRYRKAAPKPPPSPPAAAQSQSACMGVPVRNSARMKAKNPDELWPTTATCQAEDFLANSPPRKSETPYEAAETRAKTTGTSGLYRS